jgi:hypothetical protein
MASCPSCHLGLPLRTTFAGGPLVCPHCHSELDASKHWWQSAVPMVGALAAWEGARNLLVEMTGASRLSGFLGGLAVYFAVYVLLHLALVRYRLKEPPLSIRSR